MPFKKTAETRQVQPLSDSRNLFIGRTNELHFFVECILKPLDPTHNIISIAGNGGVGKSTLLQRYLDETRCEEFKDYCLAALVDERQATPISMMEKMSEQLNLAGEFEKALAQYREGWSRLLKDGETRSDAFLRKAPDIAGTVVEDVPMIGGLLKEGAAITTRYLVNKYNAQHIARDLKHLENPLARLTQAFVSELNRLADAQVVLPAEKLKRSRRVLLCFDTFEQLAYDANPWLLEYFLEANISTNIVLIFASRVPLERTIAPAPLSWNPYNKKHILYPITLNSFSREDATIYLIARGITDPQRLETIWHLSGGLPLYLSLLTSNPEGKIDPTADVVANFLRWIPSQEELKRRLALDASLFSRSFNQDDLSVFSYLPEYEVHSYYRWLISQPFVQLSTQNGRHSYHNLARELFQRHLYQLSPNESHATRRQLAAYYRRQIDKAWDEIGSEVYHTDEWSELTLALAQELFYLPDKTSHTQGIEQILRIYRRSQQENEVIHCLRELLNESHSALISPIAREVLQLLQQFIETDPTTPEYIDIASQLIKRVGSEPDFSPKLLARIYHSRGSAYASQEQYMQAIIDFDQAIELRPANFWAYGSRGQAYSSIKEYQRAIENFDSAIGINPHYAWAYGSRGVAYSNLKDYRHALEDFNRAIELKSTNAWTYAQRGEVYRQLEEFHRAIEDFNKAIELVPDYARAYIHRGLAYRDLKDYQRALADFEQAVTLDANDAWAYTYRGDMYRLLNQPQQAIADFDQALILNEQLDWAYAYRGLVHRDLDQFAWALEDFTNALELNGTNAEIYTERGLTFAITGAYQLALEDFEQARELDPENIEICEAQARVFLWLGDMQNAGAAYTHCLELDPTSLNAGWMAEWCRLCHTGADASTLEQLAAIEAIDPTSYEGRLCHCLIHWFYEQYADALDKINGVISDYPEEWGAYFWKGMICCALQQDDEALTALEQAREKGLLPGLLAPLRWLEESRPDFYQARLLPLLTDDEN